MSLYYEAAAVLANPDQAGGSLKSRIYKKKDLKSSPAQLFALITEASRWSSVLKDVIEECRLWPEEKKLTPVLALLLAHDLLLSKTGIAAPANHVLKLAINRHKARLSAEFTKSRVRRGFGTLEPFRNAVNEGALDRDQDAPRKLVPHPRWVRINTLKTTLHHQVSTTFAGYERTDRLHDILSARGTAKLYFEDQHIPNLIALPSKADLSKSKAYLSGEIIFQDKASCFPAYLLNLTPNDGDAIDGCAAPGNKTTHLAAIVSTHESGGPQQRVIAFERDKVRTGTLNKMVKLAAADQIVTVKGGSDFLAADPDSNEFARVGAILLDPSCSGSGIVGRDDAIKMHLPDPQAGGKSNTSANKGKKRKRGNETETTSSTKTLDLALEDTTPEETPMDGKLTERLNALSAFQLRILLHAMRFARTRKITYSTCSVHFEENEGVVFQALASSIAKEHGWTILTRDKQVEGMKNWGRRGVWEDGKLGGDADASDLERKDILNGCIRCEKDTAEGTMGFFVAAFVRNGAIVQDFAGLGKQPSHGEGGAWHDFSDNDVKEVVNNRNGEVATPSKKRKKKNKKAA